MTNIYFPDEKIEKDDVYFICYMIERVARRIHQKNSYVVNKMFVISQNVHDMISLVSKD